MISDKLSLNDNYQAYSDIYEMMEFTENLFKQIAEETGDNTISSGGNTINFKKPFLKNTMFGLLQEYTKKDLSEMDENEITDLNSALNEFS